MRANFLRICLLFALVATAVAGCGGSDDETTLTKAQVIKQGDAICKKADQDQADALYRLEEEKKMEDRPPAEQAELLSTVALAPILRQAEELAELPAPEGDAEEIEALVEAIEASVKKVRENPEIMIGSNSLAAFAAGDKVAEEYGFKECSEVL